MTFKSIAQECLEHIKKGWPENIMVTLGGVEGPYTQTELDLRWTEKRALARGYAKAAYNRNK